MKNAELCVELDINYTVIIAYITCPMFTLIISGFTIEEEVDLIQIPFLFLRVHTCGS